MEQLNLLKLVETISIPTNTRSGGQQYYVKKIQNFEKHYFGFTNNGAPCLLLNSTTGIMKPPIRLEAIEVDFAVACDINITDGEERNEIFTTVTCKAKDVLLHSYFAHVCTTILNIVGKSPNLDQVVDAVRYLIDLFQQLSTPAHRSVVGLFGELFVIHSAKSPNKAVSAWRSTTDDRFDFSIEDVRLEVKASNSRRRSHEFSLEQCIPPPGTDSILASLLVETSGGGLSLLELVNRIQEQLGNDVDLLRKLQITVASSLGDSITTALPMCFDESVSQSTLQVYKLASIPAIRTSSPEITQVRFRSDLSETPVADAAILATNRDLEDLLPNWV